MLKDRFIKLFSSGDNGSVFDYELSLFITEYLLKNKNEIPRLFRFSTADYYSIRGLETQTLYLTPAGEFNDVFEGLSCEIDDNVLKSIEKFSNYAYIKSFSEEKSNLLLWAHYANNYSGMCVEYDFSNLNDDYLYHLFPIYYSNNRRENPGLDYTIKEFVELEKTNNNYEFPVDTVFLTDTMYLFLSKSLVWQYEKEWRILATYPQIFNTFDEIGDGIPAFYKINSQTISVEDCIKAVYLGPKMEETKKKHIIEICSTKLKNVPVYSSKLSKDKYNLEFCSVE